MKVFVKGLAFALLAAVAVQFTSVDMANAHDANQKANAKCDRRCEVRYEACMDRRDNPNPSCWERSSKCYSHCGELYPQDFYSHDH